MMNSIVKIPISYRGGALLCAVAALATLHCGTDEAEPSTLAPVQLSLSETAATIKSVDISPKAPLVPKTLTQQFTATATFSDGSTQDVTRSATWSIKDITGMGVATINATGLLVAKNVGRAAVTARYQSVSNSTTVEVTAPPLVRLEMHPPEASIAKGTKFRFAAIGVYADSTMADLSAMANWSVTDLVGTDIAAIDGTGIAIGQNLGQAQVSAEFDGFRTAAILTVTAAVPVTLELNPSSATIRKGTSQRFTAIATFSDGSTQDVSAVSVWRAIDVLGTGVASVDSSGLVQGNAEGIALVSCEYQGRPAEVLLQVAPAALTGITLVPNMLSIYLHQYGSLVAQGRLSDGSTQDVSSLVTWSSRDVVGTDVASVGPAGGVYGNHPGTAEVTASFEGYTATATIEVAPLSIVSLTVAPGYQITLRGLPTSFGATATLTDGSTKDVTLDVTWTATDLSGSGVARIDNRGVAFGMARGMASIGASLGGYTGSAYLLVF